MILAHIAETKIFQPTRFKLFYALKKAKAPKSRILNPFPRIKGTERLFIYIRIYIYAQYKTLPGWVQESEGHEGCHRATKVNNAPLSSPPSGHNTSLLDLNSC